MQQVVTHKESTKLQYNLKSKALQQGWANKQIEIVDSDLGITGTSVENREGFKYIMTEVALGNVGIIFSYDVTRLSRNCADWYQLLDLCSFKKCLIGDIDGVYDPSVMNCRLLLGIKGQLAELELNTIKNRLIAGRDNKAKRGELTMKLPVGFIRNDQKKVEKDPNLEVQNIINFLFKTFFRVKSASMTLNVFNKEGLLIPRYNELKKLYWKQPSRSDISCFLKNPAYAGAYAFGKTQLIPCNNNPHKTKNKVMSQENWKHIIQDQYPGYIDWEQYQQIQKILKENSNIFQGQGRGTPKDGPALLQGLIYCGHCGYKMVVEYNKGQAYICNHLTRTFGEKLCQVIFASEIDEKIVNMFFDVINEISLNAYEKIALKKEENIKQLNEIKDLKIKRLKYDAQLAENRYNQADPNNRLVADELEKRWEYTLIELKNAEQNNLEKSQELIPIPVELKESFIELGKQLPSIWNQTIINNKHKKQFLRCLIDKIILTRVNMNIVNMRIIWKGGEVTALSTPHKVHAYKHLSNYNEMKNIIINAHAAQKSDHEIAAILNQQNFTTPKLKLITSDVVRYLRLYCRITRPRGGTKAVKIKGYLTVRQLCNLFNVQRYWITDRIYNGKIKVKKDKQQGCYVFPNTKIAKEKIKLFIAGKLNSLNFLRGH